MKIELNRRGGLSLVDQIVSRIEIGILAGEFEEGCKLPSVRSLARQIQAHPRTVHLAYKRLQEGGNLDLERGSGAYVSRGLTSTNEDREGSDGRDDLACALRASLRRGHSKEEIQAAIARWLEESRPDRLVVVDACRETAEVLVEELRGLRATSSVCLVDEACAESLAGAVVVALPFHGSILRRLAPGSTVVVATLQVSAENRAAVMSLPSGGIILVVSHSTRILSYAQAYLQTLRGHDVVIECHPLNARRGWSRVLPAADLVFADALATFHVREHSRRFRSLHLLSPQVVAETREALAVPLPRLLF